MKCKAGVIRGVDQTWSTAEIEVDPPESAEVLVRWTHAGLCHSDEHLVTGEFVPPDDVMKLMEIESISVGWQAMRDGENLRGVIVHEGGA